MPPRVVKATFVALLVGLAPAQAAQFAARSDAGEGHGLPRQKGAQAFAVSLLPLGPSTLSIGMPMAFRMTTSRTGYVHLYALNASGRTQVWLENVKLRAGTPYAFPARGLTIRATPPSGDDIVILAATKDPIQGFAGAGTTLTPFDLQLTHDGFRQALAVKTSSLPRSSWAVTESRVRILD